MPGDVRGAEGRLRSDIPGTPGISPTLRPCRPLIHGVCSGLGAVLSAGMQRDCTGTMPRGESGGGWCWWFCERQPTVTLREPCAHRTAASDPRPVWGP